MFRATDRALSSAFPPHLSRCRLRIREPGVTRVTRAAELRFSVNLSVSRGETMKMAHDSRVNARTTNKCGIIFQSTILQTYNVFVFSVIILDNFYKIHE